MVWVPESRREAASGTTLRKIDTELRINRMNTKKFISQDPVDIALLRPTMTRTATGARKQGVAAQLPVQRFKLIMISPAGGSIDQRSEDGAAGVSVDYVLMGDWDADIRAQDYWEDPDGRRWDVISIIPTNEYEVRANVQARGNGLEGG